MDLMDIENTKGRWNGQRVMDELELKDPEKQATAVIKCSSINKSSNGLRNNRWKQIKYPYLWIWLLLLIQLYQ